MKSLFSKKSIMIPALLAALLILFSSLAGLVLTSSAVETNYQNPVTAAPPLSVPNTTSCTETLISNYAFGSSGYDNPATGTYTPPSGCSAPWSMVVLTFSGNVAGRQFDRETEMWLGGAMIYMGTTPEPT
ncbi:MAG: peptide-N4-asparagine amidase A, partial [archaeon]|nr:peptide-N4-asparagine amidase A [archaeon]